MYLGPVVAAQVPDPSPQTTHPWKEKRVGPHPLSQVFSSVIPGSRYLVTSSGCYGKVFYLLLLYLTV